jgi:hypothetical protein
MTVSELIAPIVLVLIGTELITLWGRDENGDLVIYKHKFACSYRLYKYLNDKLIGGNSQ